MLCTIAMPRAQFGANTWNMSFLDSKGQLRDWRKRTRFTQAEIAAKLGMTRGGYANYEAGTAPVPERRLVALREMGFQSEVGPYTVPAPMLEIPIPYIGGVAASSKAEWSDPFESETFEYVPNEMGGRARFCARVAGDSMFDLLWPDDVAIFEATDNPKIGTVVVYRSGESKVTIKILRHDGQRFTLQPMNSNYETCTVEFDGKVLGYLVGIVRIDGSRRTTTYDPHGIRA